MKKRITHDFTKLAVWHRALQLASDIAKLAKAPAWRDAAGLRNQIRDSSQSTGANVAEGARAGSPVQFARFLGIAIASASETQHHLAFARRIDLLSEEQYSALDRENTEIRRMLIGLQRQQDGKGRD